MALPATAPEPAPAANVLEQFKAVAQSIGSQVYGVGTCAEIQVILQQLYPGAKQVVYADKAPPLLGARALNKNVPPQQLANTDLAILSGSFGVAENSAIWLTETQMGQRALPFICQHLALIIDAGSLVTDMHAAYQLLEGSEYAYGTFIAGPSKTADIEQSLVLGAHGPRSLCIFILAENKVKVY